MSAERGTLKCNRCSFVNLEKTQGYWKGMTCPRCNKGILETIAQK